MNSDKPVEHGEAEITMLWRPDAIEIRGISSEELMQLQDGAISPGNWKAAFPVFTGEVVPEDLREKPPMLGKYHVSEERIEFIPRFPFSPGLHYTAKFDFRQLYAVMNRELPEMYSQAEIIKTFSLPKATTGPATTLREIYPSADTLPANQLKLYLHFSGPMRPGNAYDHIQLFEEPSDVALKDVFLHIEQ